MLLTPDSLLSGFRSEWINQERLEDMDAIRLPTPEELQERFPITPEAMEKVASDRAELRNILKGDDTRLLAIIGPCSLDDSGAVFEFAKEMTHFIQKEDLGESLLTIFRVPPSKPRTEGGWHGLEEDSVEKAREILASLVNQGFPVALEAVKPVHFPRYDDLASAFWIGARSVSDSSLRLNASVYSDIPVLFKNAEDGSVEPAVQAMNVARLKQRKANFVGRDGQEWSMPESQGNDPSSIILRGGKSGHNITGEAIQETINLMQERGITQRGVVIDVAHKNGAAFNESGDKKSAEGQVPALHEVIKLLKNQKLRRQIRGVMIEAYNGISRTDPTVDIETTKVMLRELAKA